MSYRNSDFLNLVQEEVHSKRNRDILIDRFIDGYTIAEIAERHDLSDVQVGRIIHKYGDPLLLMLGK